MSNKKHTAVEWLYDTIIIFPESNEDLAHNARSFKQAQQMEKEQIKDAYWSGEIDSDGGGSAEQFYNKTYGKD
jgi:hypothetical protein